MLKFHRTHVVIGGDYVYTLWFLQPNCAWSLLSFLCPLQSLCHAFSSGVNHNVTAMGWLLPSPSLAGSRTWATSITRGRRLTFGDSLYYHIQWVESKDGTIWELIWGLGILVHPSPPVQAYLSFTTSFIGSIFPGQYTEYAWPEFMRGSQA